MPRRARLNLPEVPLHIVQRGNNRQQTFFANDDYAFYLECLRDSAQQHACDVHAYVLMTNHVHLLVTPYTPNGASRLMQSLGRRYVQYVNYAYHRSGTLWEGRFKASLIESESYLLTCYRYIELNPVRARMVDAPGAYRWSSYGYHALGAADPVVRDHPLYIALGQTEEDRRSAYRESFRHQLEPWTLGQIRQSLIDGLVLGTEGFKERVEKMLHRLLRVPVRGRPRKSVARERRVDSYRRTGSQNNSDPILCLKRIEMLLRPYFSQRWWRVFMTGLVVTLLTACDTTYSWKEEIRLTSGKVVIVERSQTRAFRDPLTREGGVSKYYTLKLSDPVPVKWDDSFAPVVFDIDSQSPVIIGYLEGFVCERFGNPKVRFVALRPDAEGKWHGTPLKEPLKATDVNLLRSPWRGEVSGRSTPVTLKEKELWNRGSLLGWNEWASKPCDTKEIKYVPPVK